MAAVAAAGDGNMIGSAFYEIAGLLAAAAVLGALAVRLRQPLIIVFLVVGISSGPTGLGLTTAREHIGLLAELGITILLFLVGLKLDMTLVRNLGLVALATGLGQLVSTIVFGYLIAIAVGLPWVTALYVAVALGFSSTIIVIKLLSDKREVDSLHGRIAVGVLIVQDIAVVIAIAVVGAMGTGGPVGGPLWPLFVVLELAGASLALGLLMRYVLPPLLHRLARSQELLLICAFAWAILLAAIGDAVGLSKEIGGFVAGFSLASTGYREVIGARLTSLRDFLVFFFFINLGTRLEFEDVGGTIVQAAALTLFVLVGQTIIIMAIMGALGYRRRTGFLSAVTLAQISEFSLIFVGLGITIGHIPPAVMGLVTVVGLATITVSVYLILYSHWLFAKLERWLAPFERTDPFRERRYEEDWAKESRAEVIVFGLGRFGRPLVRHLQAGGCEVLGVDFDPESVRECRSEHLRVVFGDAGDPDFLVQLRLPRLEWVVSTLRDRDVNVVLLQTLRQEGFRGKVAATAHHEEDAEALRGLGATEVWIPYRDAAVTAASRIQGRVPRSDRFEHDDPGEGEQEEGSLPADHTSPGADQ